MRNLYGAAIVMLLATSSAMATNFGQPIKNLDGTVVKVEPGQTQPTLGTIAASALVSSYKDEMDPQTGKETITPEEKFHRGRLAMKIADAKDKDLILPPEDLAMLKRLIGKAYGPLILAQAWPMIDPSVDAK